MPSMEATMAWDERASIRAEWAIDFRCYQQLCEPIEHLTVEQLKSYRRMAGKGDIPKASSRPGSIDRRVEDHLIEEPDLFLDVHWDRSHSWETRVGMRIAALRGFFTSRADPMKRLFGLEVWVSHVRSEEYPVTNYWEFIELYPPETTVAFLKLPGARDEFRRWVLTQGERDEKDFMIESGYGLHVKYPPPLKDCARAKFKRMMKILDLEPFMEETQQDMLLAAEEDAEGTYKGWSSETKTATPAEPRLTMLVRCTTRSDEDD
ncbi:hypothetical protein LTR37_010730 [Vermiconidia calcicola]|uniref:Uncharacterized protein n=1 Tax=Vermiconidia calcicola TaxID=1690605 RepID=A0ACC3N4Q7_9PEZI|nr:hypothetical protein LTR37_010730 [Vermiconidia calcicola]